MKIHNQKKFLAAKIFVYVHRNLHKRLLGRVNALADSNCLLLVSLPQQLRIWY